MKGYSKINLMNSNTKSKSTDFSDQAIKTPTPQNPITQDQTKYQLDDDYDYNRYSGNNNNNNNNDQLHDEHFPMENLKINQSATSQGTATDANSRFFKIQKQHSTGRSLQTAVKRVMSIRRSSSVSERYARIHDQYADYPFDVDVDVDEDMRMARSKNTMKKRSSTGSIFKACKRIFGL